MEAEAKISSEFASRLRRLEHGQQVRVILLLETPAAPTQGSRQTAEERKKSVESVREATRRALSDIDRALQQYGGRRLSKAPNALGSLTAQTTAEGVSALARIPSVKSVMEDQPIKRG